MCETTVSRALSTVTSLTAPLPEHAGRAQRRGEMGRIGG